MAKVKFYKGTKANLPTSGMIEEGAFYLCTDTGELYFGAGSSTLLLITDAIARHGGGANSIIPFDNPYNASGASGRNSIVFGDYLGQQSGNDILVVASGGNQNVTGNKDAVIACNGGVSIAGNESAALATSGVTVPSTLSNVLCVAGYHGTPDESETLYFNKLKNTYGDKIDSNGLTTKEGTTINSNIRAVGDIDTQYTDGQSAWSLKTFNAIASIVNGWFNDLNSKLYDWFGGVDNSIRRVTVVKKIDAAVAAKTTLFTVPNGVIAFGNGNQTQAIMLNIFYPGKMGNGSTTYSNIDFTFECVDSYAIQSGAPAGYKYSTSGSLSGGGSINNSYMFGTTGNGADAGDITFEITSKMQYYGDRGTLFDLPADTYFLYVKMELLLLPKNS